MQPTAWGRTVLSLACVAAVAGLLAGASAGTTLRALLLVELAAAVALAVLASHPRLAPTAHRPLGGTGYVAPPGRGLRLLHAAITVLYNLGIAIIVYAVLARLGVLDGDVSPTLRGWFPAAIGAYAAMLAAAAHWRVRQSGGITRSWALRVHGWALAALATVVAAVGFAMVARPRLTLPGIGPLGDADLMVLVLAAVLGVGTQLFLSVGLPTLVDLLAGTRAALRARKESSEPTQTPPFVYTILLTLGALAVVAWLLLRFDVVSSLGNFQDSRVALLLLLFPIGTALFLGFSAIQILRESRRGLYKRKVPTKLRNDLIVYSLSSAAGLASCILLGLVLAHAVDAIGPFPANLDTAKDLIVITILVTAGPIGWYMHRQNQRVDDIESRLPDFLNDLAESRRAGLTLAAALQSTSLADYGALSPEIRKMAHQVGWGIAFNDALQQFADRVKTSLVRRSVSLIIEASRTGGSVAEILKAAAKDAYEIRALTQERRVTMLTYLIVIYVVFFVFLSVIAVLDFQFVPKIIQANTAVGQAQSGGTVGASPVGGGGAIDADMLRFVYFNAAVVQAIGNGLVGGVLGEQRVTAGLRHVAIMSFVAWLTFRFVLAL